ncbi:trypsin-like serine peptidase [Hyphomonas sp.]|uniref:trypsin-like serine peptidase n=1 Tax=Hyphomonas sp. TaxID=87 RepID=UPI003F7143F3
MVKLSRIVVSTGILLTLFAIFFLIGGMLARDQTSEKAKLPAPRAVELDPTLFENPNITGGSGYLAAESILPDIESVAGFNYGLDGYQSRFHELSRSVVRVNLLFTVGERRKLVPCSGVLVDWDQVWTAGHCVRYTPVDGDEGTEGRLEAVNVRFGYESDAFEGMLVQIDESRIQSPFLTAPASAGTKQDYAILPLPEGSRELLQKSGFLPAKLSLDTPEFGTDLVIIHHPMGERMWLSRKSCRVIEPPIGMDESLFAHSCATLPGSSGAPIFDGRSGEVIALHVKGSWSISGSDSRGLLLSSLPAHALNPVLSPQP